MSSEAEQRATSPVLETPTSPVLRTPGWHARAIVHRLRMRTLLALGGLAILATLAGREFGFDSTLFLGSALVLLSFILVVCRHLVPLVDRHDRGASGEEHVGGLLNGLPRAQWRVVHDVSFGRGDIDHVAIGPPGVFVVETKSHPGPIKVDRVHGAQLRQAQAQRALVERVLGAEAEVLLVFSRAWVDRPLARRKGVRVLPARMLSGYLRSLPQSLDGEAIDRVHAALLDALERSAAPPGAETGEQAARAEYPALGRRSRLPAGGRSSFSRRARERNSRHT